MCQLHADRLGYPRHGNHFKILNTSYDNSWSNFTHEFGINYNQKNSTANATTTSPSLVATVHNLWIHLFYLFIWRLYNIIMYNSQHVGSLYHWACIYTFNECCPSSRIECRYMMLYDILNIKGTCLQCYLRNMLWLTIILLIYAFTILFIYRYVGVYININHSFKIKTTRISYVRVGSKIIT